MGYGVIKEFSANQKGIAFRVQGVSMTISSNSCFESLSIDRFITAVMFPITVRILKCR